MTDIKVHGLPPSTFTRTVLLACREKGVSYELVPAMPNDIGAINPFRKIPAITHGPLAGGQHTVSEWVSIDDLVRVATLYALTAIAFCPNQ